MGSTREGEIFKLSQLWLNFLDCFALYRYLLHVTKLTSPTIGSMSIVETNKIGFVFLKPHLFYFRFVICHHPSYSNPSRTNRPTNQSAVFLLNDQSERNPLRSNPKFVSETQKPLAYVNIHLSVDISITVRDTSITPESQSFWRSSPEGNHHVDDRMRGGAFELRSRNMHLSIVQPQTCVPLFMSSLRWRIHTFGICQSRVVQPCNPPSDIYSNLLSLHVYDYYCVWCWWNHSTRGGT